MIYKHQQLISAPSSALQSLAACAGMANATSLEPMNCSSPEECTLWIERFDCFASEAARVAMWTSTDGHQCLPDPVRKQNKSVCGLKNIYYSCLLNSELGSSELIIMLYDQQHNVTTIHKSVQCTCILYSYTRRAQSRGHPQDMLAVHICEIY